MSKAKLKLVEPTLQDQLEVAIALAARLRTSAVSAAKTLAERYPEDPRVIMQDLVGAVSADPDPLAPGAVSESKRTTYLRDEQAVQDLWRQVREADNAVYILRAQAETAATEEERRADLAAAIAEVGKADEALQKVLAAVARADGAVADAQERHGDAAKAVTVAAEAHARLFEAAIEQGHPPAHVSTVRDARRAADDAAGELTVAENAAAAMKAKLGHAEQRLSDARAAVMARARSVATSAIPRLLRDAQAIQRDLEGRRQVLSVLGGRDGAGLAAEVAEFLSSPAFPSEYAGEAPSDHPAVEPWLGIIDALVRDAEAPLPTK